MKVIYKDVLLAAVLGVIVPALVLEMSMGMKGVGTTVATVLPEEDRMPTVTVSASGGQMISMLLRGEDGMVREMPLEEYLVGVILAELPMSFEEEAKKAQAVVARTYTWKARTTGGKHGDGSVCTDSACCQAYRDEGAYLDDGGTREGLEAAREAVMDTAGMVLTYEGVLIEATYFSCSGGSTEDAVAVWGTDYPYLRATDSPGEEGAAHFTETVAFSKEELEGELGVRLGDNPESWFGFTTYTAGGGVNTMRIGGKDFPGTELRKLLGLRSTAFTVQAGENDVTFVTRGYGHRVGMSQYGADAMAAGGSSYGEILAHYYRGTALTRLQTLEN